MNEILAVQIGTPAVVMTVALLVGWAVWSGRREASRRLDSE